MAADKSVHRGAQFVRQWRLLRMLEGATRGMTAAQLKDAIEEAQSTRTLYRDLEVLQEAGFPLSNDDGCWRLLETSEGSWAIPVNPTEVVALMLTEGSRWPPSKAVGWPICPTCAPVFRPP